MKDWNALLLETIIRDNLFEQPESELKKSKIIPWLGLPGERKIQRAKKKLNITGSVVEGGFTIKNLGDVSRDQIIKTIRSSNDYGIGSRFDKKGMLYIISKDKRSSENTSVRDVVILSEDDFELTRIAWEIWDEYIELYNSIPQDVKRKFKIASTYITGWNHGTVNNARLLFAEDLNKVKSWNNSIQSDLTLLKTLPEKFVLKKRIEDLEFDLERLKKQPVNFDADISHSADNDITSKTIITQLNKSSDTKDIAQLQRDIIKMINNNPQIYPADPELKRVFDLFTKTYKDDGDWGTNMSDMIELINKGFDAGNSRSDISKTVYEKIIKYQTEKL